MPVATALLNQLLSGNQRFQESRMKHPRRSFTIRQKLVDGQFPKVAIVTCADSRVSPEIIFDQGLGDLFVVRVAGNIASFSVIGSLELAIDSFKIPLILNLGHTLCGAVESAMDRKPVPEVLAELLEFIEPAVLKMEHHNEADLNRAVEYNVHEQSRRILDRSPFIRKAIDSGQTRLISAIYEVETGSVRLID